MRSTELTNFAQWKTWNRRIVSEAPLTSGIYAFRLAEGRTIPRIRGGSDIIYIGCAARIQNRLKGHLRVMEVERNVAYRLRRVEEEMGPQEVSWETYGTHDKAKHAERLLLAQYDAHHLEFPPLNRVESGKKWRMIEEWLKLTPGKVESLPEALTRVRTVEIEHSRSSSDAPKEEI